MELGLLMLPIHPRDRAYQTVLQEDREAILLADELGFDQVWVGEHLTAKMQQIVSPLIFMATLIAETKNIKFAPAVLNLPHYHPGYVAAYAAMFDQLAQGRFILGIGTGSTATDFELFGTLEVEDRLAMTVEAIDTVLMLWNEDPPYEIQTEHWNTIVKEHCWEKFGLGEIAKPYQKPHPPIAISGMTPGSSSMRLAGERGWTGVSANFIPPVHVKTHWARYVEGCEKAGRTPDPKMWTVAKNIFVAETDAEAEDYVFNPDGSLARYFAYLRDVFVQYDFSFAMKTSPDLPDDALTDRYCLEAMVIHGSPKTVAEKLFAAREELGDFGTLLMAAHDWDDKAKCRRSLELMATEAMPMFREAIAKAQAAE